MTALSPTRTSRPGKAALKKGRKSKKAEALPRTKRMTVKIESKYPLVTHVGEILRRQYKPLVYVTEDRKWLVTESPDGSIVKRPHNKETGEIGEPITVRRKRRTY